MGIHDKAGQNNYWVYFGVYKFLHMGHSLFTFWVEKDIAVIHII